MENNVNAKEPVKLKWYHWLIFLMICGGIINMCNGGSNQNNDTAEENKNTAADSLIMCAMHAEEILKKGLKDPESYDNVETAKYFITDAKKTDKTYIQVIITYRATNSFGAMLQSKQGFSYDKNMLLIETFEVN